MTLGTKIRNITSKVGQKAGRIASLADKVGRLPFGLGEKLMPEAHDLSKYAHLVESGAEAVGDVGTKTGAFRKGGQVRSAMNGGHLVPRAPSGRGYAHLATHHLGSGAKLLHQAHEQLRSRDVISEGGRLTRSAGHHIRRFLK